MQKEKIIQAFSGNFIEVLIGFGTIMFITRNYAQEQAGSYFLMMAIVAILNNLKEGFLQNGFIKFYVESEKDPSVLKSGLMLTWAWDLMNILVFFTASRIVVALQPFVLFYIVQVVAYSHYRWVYFIHKSHLNLQTIFKVNLMVLVWSVSGLITIYLWELSMVYCLLLAGLAYGISTLSFPANLRLLRSAIGSPIKRDQLGQLIHFGKYGLLKEVAGSISHHSGVLLSAYFLTLGETALLGLANRYAILISIPGSSLSSLVYPVLLKIGINPAQLKQTAREGMGKMYALLVPLCLSICLAAPAMIWLLHGQEYAFAAVILISRVMLTTFLLPLGTGFSSLMNVMNQPEKITRLVLITSSVNICLMLVLMPWVGIWGVMVAPVITEMVGFVIMKQGIAMIQLRISDIWIQMGQFWRFWLRKYVMKPT